MKGLEMKIMIIKVFEDFYYNILVIAFFSFLTHTF